jgi:hypothetical protein
MVITNPNICVCANARIALMIRFETVHPKCVCTNLRIKTGSRFAGQLIRALIMRYIAYMIRQIITHIVFLLSICTVAFPQSNDNLERAKFITDFVLKGTGLPPSISDANIRALGRVNKINVKLQEAYDDKSVLVEERTYYMDGLQIVAIFQKGDDSTGTIYKTVVTGTKWKIENGLRIGTSIDAVVKTLGAPTSKGATAYEYCGETQVDCAIFEFKKKKVVKITFTYYWD